MSSLKMTVHGTKSPDESITAEVEQGTPYFSLKKTAALFNMTAEFSRASDGTYIINTAQQIPDADWHGVDANLRKELYENMDRQRVRLEKLNLQIFQKPELGNEEHHAAAVIIDFLESLGMKVERNLQGVHPQTGETMILDTAFKASIPGKSAGPLITIMLEYDALPMGHACGHNLIAVSGLAALAALCSLMLRWNGKLQVIGTPAEEGGRFGGKIPLLAAGHFADSDIVFITHPGDRWDTGADFLAIAGGRFTFTGVPSHAAAAPEKGVSALDAAILAYSGIETLREHIRSDARIHGIIKEGGEAANIVPSRAVLSYAVRALDQPYVDELKKKVEACVQAAAQATGAQVTIHWSFGYSAPINIPQLDDLVRDQASAEKISGIKKWDALGSSDLGNVGFEIPTCNLWFQISPEGILPHTHEFMEAAGGQEGFAAALQAGLVIALSAAALFQNPGQVDEIKTDFIKRKKNLLANNG